MFRKSDLFKLQELSNIFNELQRKVTDHVDSLHQIPIKISMLQREIGAATASLNFLCDANSKFKEDELKMKLLELRKNIIAITKILTELPEFHLNSSGDMDVTYANYKDQIKSWMDLNAIELGIDENFIELPNSKEMFEEILPQTMKKGHDLMRTLYNSRELDSLSEPNQESEILSSIGKTLYDELIRVNFNSGINSEFMPESTGVAEYSNIFMAPINFLSSSIFNGFGAKINSENASPQTIKRRHYLAIIVSLIWEIYQKNPTTSGELMKRGSYKIIDPYNKLFKLLHNYVKLTTGSSNPGFLSFYGGNQFAYKRDPSWGQSSHYKKDSEQFGIDMRFEESNTKALPILPEKCTHLLFGKVQIHGQDHTFIKFEEDGLGTWMDIYNHLGDFWDKQLTPPKAEDKQTCREKDIPDELVAIYKDFCEVSGINFQKMAIYEMFYTMASIMSPSNVNSQNLLDKQIPLMQKFKDGVEKHGLMPNMEIRHGQEIIVDNSGYLVSSRIGKTR